MKTEILLLAFVLLLSFSPVITALINKVDLNADVTSPYLNGLITASGIFMAFVSASVISKSQALDSFDFLLVKLSLLTFTGSILYFSNELLLGGAPKNSHLLMILSSLNLSALTAFWLAISVYRRSHY